MSCKPPCHICSSFFSVIFYFNFDCFLVCPCLNLIVQFITSLVCGTHPSLKITICLNYFYKTIRFYSPVKTSHPKLYTNHKQHTDFFCFLSLLRFCLVFLACLFVSFVTHKSCCALPPSPSLCFVVRVCCFSRLIFFPTCFNSVAIGQKYI